MIPLFLVGSDWTIFFLRVALGIIFIAHGWAKVKNFQGTASWFESVGFKPGRFWGIVVGILELGGGILFLAGLFVQPVAVLLAVQFIVIIVWRLKRREKLIGGYEFDLALLGALAALATLGSDLYALDPFVGPLF